MPLAEVASYRFRVCPADSEAAKAASVKQRVADNAFHLAVISATQRLQYC
jgi:hypothetical protein